MQKIKKVELKNFRSFSELNISELGDVNIIVGKNNTGKSSFLEGIYLALCTKVYIINEEVSSVFSPLNFLFLRRRANFVRTFHSFYEVEEYKSFLKKFFQYEKTKRTTIFLQPLNIRIEISENEKSLEEVKDKGIILQIKRYLELFLLRKIYLKNKFSRKKTLKELYNKFKQVWWLQIKNLGGFYILYCPEELVGYLEDIKIEEIGFSFLNQKNIKKRNKKDFLFFSDAFLFCPSPPPLIHLGRGNIYQRILKIFEKYLEKNSYSLLTEKISFFWNQKVVIEPSFTDFYISVEEEKIPLSLTGDGLKSFVVNFLALYIEKPSYLFFEEPENFMHPKMMEIFAEEIVKRGKKHQIFISTHSLEFVKYIIYFAENYPTVDIKILGFHELKEGILNYSIYSKEKAEILLFELQEDLR